MDCRHSNPAILQFCHPAIYLIRICGSNRREPLQDGHRPGFARRSSPNTKPQSLHRAGMTSTRCPAASADLSACRSSSSTSPRRRPMSRAIDDADRGASESRSMSCRRNVMGIRVLEGHGSRGARRLRLLKCSAVTAATCIAPCAIAPSTVRDPVEHVTRSRTSTLFDRAEHPVTADLKVCTTTAHSDR
jgi:hypothetical protein